MNTQLRQGVKRVGRGRKGPSRASGTQAVTRQGKEKVGKGISRDPERSQRQTEASEAAGRGSHGRARAAPGGRSCQETAEQT